MDARVDCFGNHIINGQYGTATSTDYKVVIGDTTTVFPVGGFVEANLTGRSVGKGCVVILVHFPFSVFFSIYIIAEISREIKFYY